jgi:Zn-dependent alcohol dehydrogenase
VLGSEDGGIAEAVGDQMSGIAVGDHAAMTWNPARGAWDFGAGCYCHNRSKRPTSKNIEAPTFLTRTLERSLPAVMSVAWPSLGIWTSS